MAQSPSSNEQTITVIGPPALLCLAVSSPLPL